MNHPVRLGELLVKTGVITEEALAQILELQKTERRRLGDLLAERNLVPPRQLAQILSYQLSCPWVSLTNIDIPRSLIDLFPRKLALEHTIVPVHLRGAGAQKAIYAATHDPTDEVALSECARTIGIAVRPMVAITFEIRQALARYYGAPLPSLTTAPVPLRTAHGLGASNRPAKPASPVPVPMPMPMPMRPLAPTGPISLPAEELVPISSSPSRGRPVVLVLNAPAGFHQQCEKAARAVGARVEEGSLVNAAERAKACRPAAIVVTDDIYAFDRSGLNRLAIDSDAILVVWSEDVEAGQLEPLLGGAVKRSRRSS